MIKGELFLDINIQVELDSLSDMASSDHLHYARVSLNGEEEREYHDGPF
jgi:hypothetical protein